MDIAFANFLKIHYPDMTAREIAAAWGRESGEACSEDRVRNAAFRLGLRKRPRIAKYDGDATRPREGGRPGPQARTYAWGDEEKTADQWAADDRCQVAADTLRRRLVAGEPVYRALRRRSAAGRPRKREP